MKIYTYIVILAGLSILLYFAGINTTAGLLLSNTGLIQNQTNLNNGIVDNPEEFKSSTFYNKIYLIFTGLAILGIAVGFITRSSSESILIGPFVVLLIGFVADFVSVVTTVSYNYPGSWVTYLISLIFIPLIIGYIIALVEWWRGSD